MYSKSRQQVTFKPRRGLDICYELDVSNYLRLK